MNQKQEINPLFTLLIDVYWGLPFFKEAINAIREQTYTNLEIIISNNGASQEITNFINSQAKEDSRIKIISYKENLFRLRDPNYFFFVIANDGLKKASGKYFFYQSYDDMLAPNYIEKMIKLFEGNPSCISASGRQVNIDEKTSVDKDELLNRTSNFRPRYMPGYQLVLETLKPNGSKVFSASGTCFSFKRDVLISQGGFYRSEEAHELYGLVPLGETGFDEDAILFWRKHEGQTNKLLYNRGHSGLNELYDFIDEFQLQKKWEVHGKSVAKKVVDHMTYTLSKTSADQTLRLLSGLRFAGALRLFFNSITKHHYRNCLYTEFMAKKRHYLLIFIYQFHYFARPLLKLLNSFISKRTTNLLILKRLNNFFFLKDDWYLP